MGLDDADQRRKSAILDDFIATHHNELIPEPDIDDVGQVVITGAVLILRGRDMGETEFCYEILSPFGLGLTEIMGMCQRASDRIRDVG